MSTFAYWINLKGKILKPDTRHIGAIVSKPSLYGETDKTVKATYEKHGEPISSTVEGKAREEIMLRVIMRGYIRIRKSGTRRDQRWSIQVAKLNNKNRDYLWAWAREVIDSKVADDKYADVHIHQLAKKKVTKTSLNKIASGETIREELRIYTQKEANEEWEDYFDYAHEYFDLLTEQAQQELIDRGYVGHLITERIALDESSFSRVWTHIRQDKRSFGVISPFRSPAERGLPKKENDKTNEDNYTELKNAVRTLGYGYIELQGGFKSESGFNLEKSLFIPNIKRKEAIELGKKYDQYSVLYKNAQEFVEIGTNKHSGVGRVKNRFEYKEEKNLVLAQDAMRDFFSKLIKGSHRGQKFLFKLQEKEVGSFNRMAYGQTPLAWTTIYEEK